jgi:tetratricopeptide (TPR) repeat protein
MAASSSPDVRSGLVQRDPDAVRGELERVLASAQFRGSQRRSQLLRYLVERALGGQSGHLKEYILGVEVFDKGSDYDPRIDPVVRVEMTRVRAKLAEYYAGEGQNSLLRIELPKGSYAPNFRLVQKGEAANAVSHSWGRRWWVVLAVFVVIAVSSALAWSRVHGRSAGNEKAQALCTQARFFWDRRTPEALRTSVELYQEAIRRAPRYAPAYGGLALTYAVMAADGQVPAEEGAQNAVESAREAITLDPNVADAHAAIGLVEWSVRYDWDNAEAELRKGLALDPGFATGHQWLALDLLYRGRCDEAVAEMQKALKLVPTSLAVNTAAGLVSYYARRYDDAIAAAHRTLDLDSSFRTAHLVLGMALEAKKRWAEAEREYAATRLASDGDSEGAAHLAHLYAVTGRTAAAERILDQLLARPDTKNVDAYQLAFVYAALSRKAEALEWLERSASEHTAGVIKVDPYMDPLRSEPQFAAVLAQLHLNTQ